MATISLSATGSRNAPNGECVPCQRQANSQQRNVQSLLLQLDTPSVCTTIKLVGIVRPCQRLEQPSLYRDVPQAEFVHVSH